MCRRFRIHAAIVLTVLLILTGQGLAMARGSAGPVGQTVLCAGSGPVIVYLDADGNPTGPPHFCPDFALHVMAVALLPVQEMPPQWPHAAAPGLPAAKAGAGRALRSFHARAPPGFGDPS